MNKRIVLATPAVAAIAGLGWLVVLRPGHEAGGSSVAHARAASARLPALPWQGEVRTESPAQIRAIRVRTLRAAAAARDIDPATGLPPASAGSNGSYTPPPPSDRRHVYSATHLAGGSDSWSRTALQINRTALAPPGAPDEIKGVISAANMLVGQPYRLGGGHASWRSRGYDCSGAVSFALAGGGLVGAPMASGGFMSWGAPGQGRWLTVYANPGHVYAVVAGLRWDTVGDARGSGPRWHPFDAYPQGFVARHFPGL